MAIQVRVDIDGEAKVALGMPEVSLDSSLRAKRNLGHALGVHGPFEPKGKLIADGLVRLVDKSILEYQEARGLLIRFYSNGGYLNDYHRAQDHFESCIQSLHRAIKYVNRLRNLGYSDQQGSPLVPRPRDLEVIQEGVPTEKWTPTC